MSGERESDPVIPLARPRTAPVPRMPTERPRPNRPEQATQAPSARRPGAFRAALATVASTRVGAAGLLVAALLVMVAVFADLLASDLPLACRVGDTVHVLPNVTRPAALAGKDAAAIAREATWAVFPLVAHGPTRVAAAEERAVPLARPFAVAGHPLGTDREGRDVFARVVHGTRGYLIFALVAVLASLILGALVGGVAGLYGGAFDALLGRAIETVSAFPPLVLVIGIQAAVPEPTLATLFFAIALTRWPEVARLVRGQVMLIGTRDFVLAARALGASPARVLLRHIAPNVRAALIVSTAVGISSVVLTEASLDFLHVGAPPGAASWGETMSQFRGAPHAWWLLVFPGALLFATVIGHNLVGEAFRDALDPRRR